MQTTSLQEIIRMAKQARGQIDKVYIHWTAGHWNQWFSHYHLNVGTTEIKASTTDLTEFKSHTYYRNTGAVGIALTCCCDATTEDLGDVTRLDQHSAEYLNGNNIPYEPPTDQMIEMTAQVMAAFSYGLGLPMTVEHFMTHAEAANNEDGTEPHAPYGPGNGCERWDLWFLANGQEQGSGGQILRGKAVYYLQQWGMA